MRKHLFVIALVAVSLPVAAFAQGDKFQILDNSFFIEEGFNQERGIFQNIFSWTRDRDGEWNANFTQEWPAPTITNQLSFTIPFGGGEFPAHFGSVLLNYRCQVFQEGERRPAFSPRLSVILPTGRSLDASDRPGLQFNLPVSKQVGDFYVHLNAGSTWLQGVPAAGDLTTNLMSPAFGGSVIWNTRPYFNLMLESVLTLQDTRFGDQSRQKVATISPGVRGGWTMSDSQVILGAAVPVTYADDEPWTTAFLMYFSYELAFSPVH